MEDFLFSLGSQSESSLAVTRQRLLLFRFSFPREAFRLCSPTFFFDTVGAKKKVHKKETPRSVSRSAERAHNFWSIASRNSRKKFGSKTLLPIALGQNKISSMQKAVGLPTAFSICVSFRFAPPCAFDEAL
jgi:hypothetical protein